MSAKKYFTIPIIAALLANISVYAQNEPEVDLTTISQETNPQFLIRTELNGTTKYVGCALPNLYFHKATTSTPEEESIQAESEFTAKGGDDNIEGYYGYVFFLVKDDTIQTCNESGNFKEQPEGLYTLSRFFYPLSVSPESFIGKEIDTIVNHPLFEKDPTLYNIVIRLLAPKKTESTASSEENILGQIQQSIPASN